MLARRCRIRRPFFDVALQRAVLAEVPPGALLGLARRIRVLAAASGYRVDVAALLRIAVPHKYWPPNSICVFSLDDIAIDLVGIPSGRLKAVPAHNVVVSQVGALRKRECGVFAVFPIPLENRSLR